MKIAIVGDVHIDKHVSSRRDDYFQTCLQKIEEISSQNQHIIFLGDLFNRDILPQEQYVELCLFLYEMKAKYNCFYYSIIGNHDIVHEDEANLSRSSLGALSLTTSCLQLITVNNPITIGNFTFYTSYVNLDACREHLKTLHLGENDILLLHHYFEDAYEGLNFDDVINIGCKHIFVGHEHTPFPDFRKQLNDVTVYRSGSLLRNSANEANLTRGVYYFVYDDEWKVATVECAKPAKEVFTDKAFTQENLHRKHFIQNISEVINKYTNNASVQSKFSIKQTLLELQTPSTCMEYIASKYNMISEVFS